MKTAQLHRQPLPKLDYFNVENIFPYKQSLISVYTHSFSSSCPAAQPRGTIHIIYKLLQSQLSHRTSAPAPDSDVLLNQPQFVSMFLAPCGEVFKTGHSTLCRGSLNECQIREDNCFLLIMATLSSIQPDRLFSFFMAIAYCWFMISLPLTNIAQGFFTELLPRLAASILHVCKNRYLHRGRTFVLNEFQKAPCWPLIPACPGPSKQQPNPDAH